MCETHATEVGFILDLAMVIGGAHVSVLLSSMTLKNWVSRLILISVYVTAVTGFVIKAICMRSELQVTDYSQYYFDALIFILCSIFSISVVLKFLED